MCRHLVYLGPPVTLAALLLDPPHSLLRQSWAPHDMRDGGTVNVDGFGAGWYQPGAAAPIRYRRACPIWADESFARLARATASGAVLAALRSGTVGMPLVETACAPFTEGPWLFSLNGLVAGWPDAVTKLAGQLPLPDLLTLDAPTDSALVWALVRHRLRAGASAPEAVAHTATELAAHAPGSLLNLLLTDGVTAVATTLGHSLALRVCHDDDEAGAVVLASEPFDADPAWRGLPDGQLVTATTSTVDCTTLPIGRRRP